ncbi:MAG: hypothetical protein ACFFBD_26380, partial [Candidatus Hodarchaeota archaeon]
MNRVVRRIIYGYPVLKYRKYFKDLRTFILFIGSSRSGSSLVGALLDAHPNVIIAQERNVLKKDVADKKMNFEI